MIKETFSIGQVVPVGAETTNDDITHGVVVDDLVPKELESLAEIVAIVGMTNDMIFGVFGVSELTVESPKYAFIEEIMAHAHEITLDVELYAKSGFAVVFGNAANVGSEALLSIKSTFVDAARIRIDDKMTVPPVATNIEK